MAQSASMSYQPLESPVSPLLKAGAFALLTGAVLTASTACVSSEQPSTAPPPVIAPSAPAQPTQPAQPAQPALDVVGLVDGTSLVTFTTASTTPGQPTMITGLDGDNRLVGIDYRVQDGMLYGVGDAGGLYSLTDAGAATKVGNLTVNLDGEQFGVDFNPAANALRIISNTGQNLRQSFAMMPLPGTVGDGALTNPAMAPATGTTPAMGVTAAAYTNNDVEMTTATTLFDLDTMADRVSLQSPANDGTLAPTGNLGVDAGPDSGFDIHSDADGMNTGYATLQSGGSYQLYRIDLLSGEATSVGTLDGAVSDIAVDLAA